MPRIIAAVLSVALSFLSLGSTALANEVTQTQQYQNGQLVQSSDLSGDQEAMRNLTGISATMLLGAPNALPMVNPLAITASTGAMTFSIGGTGQFVLAQDVTSGNARVIDSCPLQGFTIPSNPGPGSRTDLLAIQYQQPLVGGHSIAFNTGVNRTVFNALEGCSYNYVTGSTSTPFGYLGFATISVPAGATTASAATITYLFKTVGQLILAELGGNVVTSVSPGVGVTIGGTRAVPIVGLSHGDYVDTTATAQTKIGPLSATSLSATDLPPGRCLQTGTGGVFQTASGPCGLGSGSVTSVNAGTGITVTGAASAPTVGLAHGEYIDQSATPQTKLGSLSLSNGLTISSGNLGMSGNNQGAYFGYSINTQGNYYAGVGADACLWANQSSSTGLCVNSAGNGSVTHNFSAPGTLTTGGIVSAGNIYANNGVFAAPASSILQLCPNNTCGGTYVDTAQNFHANIVAATQFAAPGGSDLRLCPNNTCGGTYVDTSQNFHANIVAAAQLNSAGNISANNGVFAAPGGSDLRLCPNNTCGGTYVDTSQNFHANIVAAAQLNGSGAGISAHTIPDTSLVQTPVTGFLNGPGIAISGPTTAITVANTGVTSLAGIGNIATTGSTGGINISSNALYDSNSGVYRPTGIICSGSTLTNSSSQATVSCGAHIYGATATLFDTGYVNFFWLRVQAISGGAVTFGVGNQNGVGAGSGVGFFYTISSYF